jgi:hypothetical protein
MPLSDTVMRMMVRIRASIWTAKSIWNLRHLMPAHGNRLSMMTIKVWLFQKRDQLLKSKSLKLWKVSTKIKTTRTRITLCLPNQFSQCLLTKSRTSQDKARLVGERPKWTLMTIALRSLCSAECMLSNHLTSTSTLIMTHSQNRIRTCLSTGGSLPGISKVLTSS